MNIDYRVVVPDDHDELVSLWSSDSHIGYSESDSPEHMRAYLERNPDCSFVAVDSDRIVGSVMAGEDARRGFINHLYVRPQYRGKGVGSKLAALAEDALAQRFPTKSYVFVKYDNEDAIRFWRRRGYYLCDDFCVMRTSLSSESYASYSELDEEGVVAYLKNRELVPCEAEVRCAEFGDGNLNHIYRVTWEDSALIVKQSMPHGKIDVTCFEPVCRGVYESRYVTFFETKMAGMLEHRLYSDEIMALSVYEDYSPCMTLRHSLAAGQRVVGVGSFLGTYLANELFYSSVFSLGIEQKKQLESTFSNMRSRKLTEDYILVSPFYDSPDNCVEDAIRPLVEQVWSDGGLKTKARLLAAEFVSNKQCLIHGDFHPGNIFTRREGCIVSDFDFASWGPVSYDLGTMTGNLIISCECWARKADGAEMCSYILKQISDMYAAFADTFSSLLSEEDCVPLSDFLRDIVASSFGYAGCTIAGRSYGYCRFSEITSIADPAELTIVFGRLLEDMRFLMLKPHNVEELVSFMMRE